MQRFGVLFTLVVMLFSMSLSAQPFAVENVPIAITPYDVDLAQKVINQPSDEAIKQWAAVMLAAQKAKANKLDQTEKSRWLIWQRELKTGEKELFQQAVLDQVEVTTAELKAYYHDQNHRFHRPERYSFRHIFGDTTEYQHPADIQKVYQRMVQARQELAEAADEDNVVPAEVFEQVADKYSDVQQAPGQVVGPFTLVEPLQPIIKSTALSLKPGQVSEIISTKYGYEIIQLEDHVPAVTAEFEMVADKIREMLWRPRVDEAVVAFRNRLIARNDRYQFDYEVLATMVSGPETPPESEDPVVTIDGEAWNKKQIESMFSVLHPSELIPFGSVEEATRTLLLHLVLPLMLHQDAIQAGFVNQPTQQAALRYDVARILAGEYAAKELSRLAADLPEPTTLELQQTYAKESSRFRARDRYDLEIICFHLSRAEINKMKPADVEFWFRRHEVVLENLSKGLQNDRSVSDLISEVTEEFPGIKHRQEQFPQSDHFAQVVWNEIEKNPVGEWSSTPLRFRESPNEGVMIWRVTGITEGKEPPLEKLTRQMQLLWEIDQRRQLDREIWERLAEEAEPLLMFRDGDNN